MEQVVMMAQRNTVGRRGCNGVVVAVLVVTDAVVVVAFVRNRRSVPMMWTALARIVSR